MRSAKKFKSHKKQQHEETSWEDPQEEHIRHLEEALAKPKVQLVAVWPDSKSEPDAEHSFSAPLMLHAWKAIIAAISYMSSSLASSASLGRSTSSSSSPPRFRVQSFRSFVLPPCLGFSFCFSSLGGIRVPGTRNLQPRLSSTPSPGGHPRI